MIWLYASVSIGALVFAYYFGVLTGAQYVPTDRAKVMRMLAFAQLKPGEKLVDLGSGDGRIVIEAALRGATAHGFEVNPVLVWLSRRSIRKAGLADRASVSWRNFWREDFSAFDVVAIYGIPHIMPALEKKLMAELKPGARVVCNDYPFPAWQGSAHSRIYSYTK